MKRSLAAWCAVVVPVWLVFALCTYWEPVLRDGWGHYIWHRNNDVTPGSLWEFAKASYVHNNPRFGQVLTLLQHTPGPWHVIVTPIVELGMFVLLTTLVLGRWPSLRRTDDALLFVTITAMVFATARSLGPMLFYRPFTGNYLFGLVLNLLWLVPYRMHAEQPLRGRWWLIPAMLVLGFFSGLSNEHTGPALVAAAMVALFVFWRRGERFVPWALAGLVGMLAGGSALFFAPGQDIRYRGLATELSTLDRIIERGAHGNGRIIFLAFLYLTPLVVWLALGLVGRLRKAGEAQPRSRWITELVGCGVALAIVLTLLASPKQGDRLYFASTCLACAAAGGWVVAQLGRIEKLIAVAMAAIMIAYVSWRLVTTYHTIGTEYADRIAEIERAAPGSTIKVAPYSQKRSRWVIADDFEVPRLREAVAFTYGLAAIELLQRVDTTPAPDEP